MLKIINLFPCIFTADVSSRWFVCIWITLLTCQTISVTIEFKTITWQFIIETYRPTDMYLPTKSSFYRLALLSFVACLNAQSHVDIQRSFWFITLLTAVSKIPFKLLDCQTLSAVGVEQRMIYHLFLPLVSRRKHHNLVFSMCTSLLYSSRVIGEVTLRNLRFNVKSRMSRTWNECVFTSIFTHVRFICKNTSARRD